MCGEITLFLNCVVPENIQNPHPATPPPPFSPRRTEIRRGGGVQKEVISEELVGCRCLQRFFNPSPVTRHPSPVTRHPLPVTRYPPPVTRHPAPGTRHPAPGTRHPRKSPAGQVTPTHKPKDYQIRRSSEWRKMTMSRWHLDFFTFPETNAMVQWHIHVKVNKKVCSTTTAVHDFSQLLL